MKMLSIESSDTTPEIIMDKTNSIFRISGKSLTEEAVAFYQPVNEWLTEYSKQPNDVTDFELKMEYVDAASSKMILGLFFILQKIKGAKITWYFLEDDEDMEETGEEFGELMTIPFELKAY